MASPAIAAARALGPEEGLAETGLALSRLAAHTASTDDIIATAEDAWQAVRYAMAYLLTVPAQREGEAQHALLVALDIAGRLASDAVAVVSPGIAFVLVGERAEIVQRWLLRAQLLTRRPARVRLARGDGVSLLVWLEWQAALNAADPRGIAASLARVRQDAPAFLREDGDVTSVARWLEARRGSVAVAVSWPSRSRLAWLMTVDERGHRRTWIVGLEVSPPPLASAELATRMSNVLHGPDGHHAQLAMAAWARRHFVEPL